MTGPEPVIEVAAEQLGEPFDPSEINPGVVPVVAQGMLQTCPADGLELSQVIIERNTTYDPGNQPVLEVYADNERGEGGYIVYALDGTPLANYCD
jgi:hypothetical protein